jgi:hypothetical protein
MANEIQIMKDFPPSRERTVLLELLAVTQALEKEGIDAIVCGGGCLSSRNSRAILNPVI